MRLADQLSLLKDELRSLHGEGFGAAFSAGRHRAKTKVRRLADELRWYAEQKRALLALVVDSGGITTSVNLRTQERTVTSERPSVGEIVAQVEGSHGDLPARALICLRMSLIRGGYIGDVDAANALDLRCVPAPEPTKKKGLLRQ